MPTGTATISFGSTPVAEGSVTVTGQTSITSSSFVEAFSMVESTTDNTTTDHLLAGVMFRIVCGNIVNSTGFTIYVTSIGGLVTGDFKIKWVYT